MSGDDLPLGAAGPVALLSLATTGAAVGWVAGIAVSLVVLGALLVRVTLQRRHHDEKEA
ncbi:hypothetical protein [Luteimicrobium subarcticum]|uniref:Uncharacterized protein n=1 Tax=Luteimicrobium subarcticum TaxID=620910 RepID=A0A2M8W6P0_9MICO|nr:hypothetical protein [Luteimicrobium subarcticum]PJI86564.1 hypothetical protein CLV34_2482 [Luteimicrobium subarcticum]